MAGIDPTDMEALLCCQMSESVVSEILVLNDYEQEINLGATSVTATESVPCFTLITSLCFIRTGNLLCQGQNCFAKNQIPSLIRDK